MSGTHKLILLARGHLKWILGRSISSRSVKAEKKGPGGVIGMTKCYLQVSHPLSLEASSPKLTPEHAMGSRTCQHANDRSMQSIAISR